MLCALLIEVSSYYELVVPHYLLFSPVPMPRLLGLDQEMSDISDPCTRDSDIAGPGATLNNDAVDIDVTIDVLSAYLVHQCEQSIDLIYLLLCKAVFSQ